MTQEIFESLSPKREIYCSPKRFVILCCAITESYSQSGMDVIAIPSGKLK